MSIKIRSAPTAITLVIIALVVREQVSRYGRVVSAVMTAVAGLWISLAAGSTVPFERTLVVVFLLIAPAAAVIRLLPSVNGVVVLVVGAAGVAVINLLVAQIMLAINAWSPQGGVVTVGLVAALL